MLETERDNECDKSSEIMSGLHSLKKFGQFSDVCMFVICKMQGEVVVFVELNMNQAHSC